MAVDHGQPQAERLCHPDQRVVDRTVSVRVQATHHLAHHACALDVPPIWSQTHLRHLEQDAPLHRLQAVAGIGQGTPDDHAHRVVEVRPSHLLFEADGEGFLGEGGHEAAGGSTWRRASARRPAGLVGESAGF